MSMEMDQGQGELNNSMTATMSSIYNDDDPLRQPPSGHTSRSGVVVLKAHCEYPSVPNYEDHDGFVVMLHVKAPPLVSPSPVDLVAVIDVSESMATGDKLAEVKRAMGFVVDRLSPRDRLSVVAFSGDAARRVTRLTRMTGAGKAAAKRAVDALDVVVAASGGGSTTTNARAALDEAARVFSDRRQGNDVTGVILVSDGHDSCAHLPKFFLRDSNSTPPPVHTFGLGSDLDAAAAAAMHGVSEATGGTFSFIEFIEDHAVIQDALAQCIGGLRSVTAMDVSVVFSFDAEVIKLTEIKSGRYKNSITLFEGEEADVYVGELYANEEKRFLLYLEFPAEDDELKFSCSYTDMASGQPVTVEMADGYEYIEIEGVARCVELQRELLRVAAVEDMAMAREAAERGAYDEAVRILDARRDSLLSRSAALSGDAMCKAVADELHELSQRVSDEREYRKTGRACILASMSSHGLQRGSSSSVWFGCGVGSSVFATPAMRKMDKLSETMRKQQEAPPRPPPLPENGSKTGVPVGSHRRLEARLASAVPRLSMLNKYRRLLLKR